MRWVDLRAAVGAIGLGCLLSVFSPPLRSLGIEAVDEEVIGEHEGTIPDEAPVLELPAWGEKDVEIIESIGRPLNLGGGLWPEEQVPLESEENLAPPVTEPLPPPEPIILQAPEPIPAEFLDAYFGARPERFLVDPQGLLDEPTTESVERFLAYHAKESSTDAFVLVMERHHELPVGISTADTWRRWFGEGAGAIILYHLGEPRHTAIEFGPDLAGGAGRARLQRLLDACVRDALEVGDPGAQLDRFCVRFSVESYWLEGEMVGGVGVAASRVVDDVADDPGTRWGKVVALGLLGLLLAGAGVVLYWGWLLRPLRVPRLRVDARLGGPHCGGTDAVVSFAKKRPLADAPDGYARRI